MYLINFRKLIELVSSKANSPSISDLCNYVDFRKRFYEIKNSENFKENAQKGMSLLLMHLNYHSWFLDNFDESAGDLTFMPKLYSTSVKPRKSDLNFFNQENSIVLTDRGNIVDETVEDDSEKTPIEFDNTMNCVDETIVAKKAINKIASAHTSQNSLPFETSFDELNESTLSEPRANSIKEKEIEVSSILTDDFDIPQVSR